MFKTRRDYRHAGKKRNAGRGPVDKTVVVGARGSETTQVAVAWSSGWKA